MFRRCGVLLLVVSMLAGTIERAHAADGVVATLNGQPITDADLDKVIKGRLIALQAEIYDAKREGIDAIIVARLLADQAKVKGVTVDELLQRMVNAKITDPTEQEIQQVYDQSKADLGALTLEEVKPQIIEQLRATKMESVRDEYIQQLREQAKIEITLQPPSIDVPAVGPSRGNANAPVTIIEFSDYQCPYCASTEEAVKKVLESYKDKVRLVYRDYPLSFHEQAQKAAEAARCAGDQGKYWEYHDTLFAKQGALEPAELVQYATDLKLDGAKFKECLDGDKYADAVAKDVEAASQVGVTGTPTFFVNGRLLGGAQSYEAFSQVIDELLKAQGPAAKQKPAGKK
jgi:protein-disulfide isomerase